MPIYEYLCESNHKSELFVRGNPFDKGFKSPAFTDCDTCGETALRIISPCGISVDKEFISEHLHPKGKKILVKNKSHHKALMKRFGVHRKND